jgi:hypothetical protein
MLCRWQYSTSFFSRRGLVWATNQRNADTRRRIRKKFPDVNLKLLLCAKGEGVQCASPIPFLKIITDKKRGGVAAPLDLQIARQHRHAGCETMITRLSE